MIQHIQKSLMHTQRRPDRNYTSHATKKIYHRVVQAKLTDFRLCI